MAEHKHMVTSIQRKRKPYDKMIVLEKMVSFIDKVEVIVRANVNAKKKKKKQMKNDDADAAAADDVDDDDDDNDDDDDQLW